MATLQTGNRTREFVTSDINPREVAFNEIPVIDLSPAFADDAGLRKVAEAVRDACVRVGFFYVKHHGVDRATIDAAFAQAENFFSLPLDVKMKIHVGKSPNFRGYTPLLGENTDSTARGDLHEAFDLALDVPAESASAGGGKTLYGPNVWPQGIPGFKEALTRYYDEMLILGRRLFRIFAVALDLPPAYFDRMISKPAAIMRLLYYPSQQGEIDERQIGIGAHSDYECFTILAQDAEVAALQILNTEGQWIAAKPIPGTFVVNIGDQMARWTNDYFASTVHRAVNRSGRERYSIPFFFGTNYDTLLEVLPSCVGPNRPAKYAPITAGDYVAGRLSETYAHSEKP